MGSQLPRDEGENVNCSVLAFCHNNGTTRGTDDEDTRTRFERKQSTAIVWLWKKCDRIEFFDLNCNSINEVVRGVDDAVVRLCAESSRSCGSEVAGDGIASLYDGSCVDGRSCGDGCRATAAVGAKVGDGVRVGGGDWVCEECRVTRAVQNFVLLRLRCRAVVRLQVWG